MINRGVETHRFNTGDRVVHPKRPEWGTGIVRKALGVVHEGKPAQRLEVDFPNKGRVALNTAIAPLLPAGAALRSDNPFRTRIAQDPEDMTQIRTSATTTSGGSGGSGGWLAQLERKATGKAPTHELWELPEELSDPFLNDAQRLAHTLETYKYSTEARSLIEWAIRQTGLNDPLTKYTRTDMEQAFPRFARDRDNHLKDLVRNLKRNGQIALLQDARNKSRIPAAVSALDKAMRA